MKKEHTADESWLMELFDICPCKCLIIEDRVFEGKALSSCQFESRVNSLEIKFFT